MKKIVLSNLSSDSSRKARASAAIKKARNKNFKDGKFPSSDRARKLKEWRDGWFK